MMKRFALLLAMIAVPAAAQSTSVPNASITQAATNATALATQATAIAINAKSIGTNATSISANATQIAKTATLANSISLANTVTSQAATINSLVSTINSQSTTINSQATALSATMLAWLHGSSGGGGGGTGNYTFTPLHTYFMSATGNDSNNGTTPSTPWATPNHSVVCGDVIIAAAGTYSAGQLADNFPTPSGCPSSSGGIDETGGIWAAVVLCAGPDLMSCNVTTTGGSGSPCDLVEWTNNQSYWAIEGFNLNSTPTCRGYAVLECNTACSTPYFSHHIAVINSIVSNSRQAFGTNDQGQFGGSTSAGLDYVAVVGMIAQNANQEGAYQGGICVSAIDFVSLGKYNTTAGTHAFMNTNYAMANLVPACSGEYDGEAFMIDSPDAHGFQGTVVISNNIAYDSTRACIQLTPSNTLAEAITFNVYSNTCFSNNMQPGSTGANNVLGEFNYNTTPSGTWTISLYNNIILPPAATESGVPLYAVLAGGAVAGWAEGTAVGAGDQNVVYGYRTSCDGNGGTSCSPTSSPYAEAYFNITPATNTQNTFVTAAFTNTTDLLANHVGVPNCTGFTNTTACMGWNATTATLTTPSVISDLAAGCTGCAGKGFQRPSVTCAANSDYPTWLKGLVYLQVSGTYPSITITETAGLVSKPCGL